MADLEKGRGIEDDDPEPVAKSPAGAVDRPDWAELEPTEARTDLSRTHFDYLAEKEPLRESERSLVIDKKDPARVPANEAIVDRQAGPVELPEEAEQTFDGSVTPFTMEKDKTYYRIVGKESVPLGDFWIEKIPSSEEQWRRDYAVKRTWNGNHGVVEFTPAEDIHGWRGRTGAQRASSGDGYMPGGSEQIWVPGDTVRQVGGRCKIRQFN